MDAIQPHPYLQFFQSAMYGEKKILVDRPPIKMDNRSETDSMYGVDRRWSQRSMMSGGRQRDITEGTRKRGNEIGLEFIRVRQKGVEQALKETPLLK
jgi:hypothetical protein